MSWDKGALLEKSGSYWQSCALHTGVKLDVFTVIGSGDLSAEEVADRINGDPRGVSALLNALSAMGLLDKARGLFSNTDFSKNFLSKDSDDYTGFIIMHHHHLMESWTKMSEAVLSGKPNRSSVSDTDKDTERESFLMGMFNIASATAPMYAKALGLGDRERLLDLGGGPGTYAIHFCLNNPGLKATVFDLPATRKFAEKTIASFGLSDRIGFKEGSYLDKNIRLDQDYDAAWLSHILHGEGPREAASIVARAADALKTGGKILIHEFILNDAMDGPLFPALFALNMLAGTDKGQSYSEAQLRDMLEKSGIANIQRLDLRSPNDAGILAGEKS
ncbi:SAM-dependent methyltransferase [Candidatus Desulfarcum epimagneticum]|uniref:SAM-dependent methyltransferase n=1 Tax=uncultured Desulfobacteraceae bacterium TaxID=218296 RepID=A0A484HDI7_9BACT|nr:SAM-dependent methyltransferase [uncultured Desulfobacteraceae bacterium]